MTGIFVTKAPGGKPRCARCKRPFTPRKEGDRYGPKCARKLGGLAGIRDRIDKSGEVTLREWAAEIRDRSAQDAETKHTVIV